MSISARQVCEYRKARWGAEGLAIAFTNAFLPPELSWERLQMISRYAKWILGNPRINGIAATSSRVLATIALFLVIGPSIYAQGAYSDNRPRLLVDGQIGSQTSLGYNFPSISVGSSAEVPVAKRFEVQSSSAFSPDRKAITNDGKLVSASASLIAFAGERLGFIATLERDWLWTSQFDKSVWYPQAGVVLRNDYFGHGRLYVTYTFPTGCQWATAASPCTIQSNRLQGVTIRQDVRTRHHMRWGVQSGIYRFCDQGNPNEPQAGRNCHWGATALALVRFEFHAGRKSHFTSADADDSDNF